MIQTVLRSNASDFNVISAVFDDPDFTFFESREFFLSPTPHCDAEAKMKVERQKVPVSKTDKRSQHEQRLRVKQITAGLTAVAKHETAFGQAMLKQLDRSNWTELPALELHIFPKDPLDVESQWQVLLVPRAPSLFGKRVYLCRPSQWPAPGSPAKHKCVARAKFEPLPTRLRNLWGGWDPNEDPLRTAPHRILFGLEVLLLLVVAITACVVVVALWKYGCLALAPGESENQEGDNNLPDHAQSAKKLLQEPLPKSYKLIRHAKVYQKIQGEAPAVDVLDAGHEILVLEVICSERSGRSLLKRLLHGARGLIFPTPPAVWGRLEEPEGWILLSGGWRGAMGVLGASDRAPYRANQRLMVPLDHFFRKQLVLATSHASVQWLLLANFRGLMPLGILLVLAASLTCMHVLVLQQVGSTLKWGIWCDHVLEQRRQRLRPHRSHAAQCFVVCLSVMVLASVLAVAFTSSAALSLYLALVVAVSLHAWDLKASLEGLGKWREPELVCEFTEFPSEKLPSTDAKPSTLTRKRESWQ